MFHRRLSHFFRILGLGILLLIPIFIPAISLAVVPFKLEVGRVTDPIIVRSLSAYKDPESEKRLIEILTDPENLKQSGDRITTERVSSLLRAASEFPQNLDGSPSSRFGPSQAFGIEMRGELVGYFEVQRPREGELPVRIGGETPSSEVMFGYYLIRSQQRKGIMPEVVKAFVNYINRYRAQLGVGRIYAHALKNNRASRLVLERSGFEQLDNDDRDYAFYEYALVDQHRPAECRSTTPADGLQVSRSSSDLSPVLARVRDTRVLRAPEKPRPAPQLSIPLGKLIAAALEPDTKVSVKNLDDLRTMSTRAIPPQRQVIIDHLTEQLAEGQFDSKLAAREIVANAQDASSSTGVDPAQATVRVKVGEGRFDVTDSGTGMSFEDVVTRLLVFFRSSNVAVQDPSRARQNVTGRFGLGFFSVLSYLQEPTDEVRITTRAKGQPPVFVVIQKDPEIQQYRVNFYGPEASLKPDPPVGSTISVLSASLPPPSSPDSPGAVIKEYFALSPNARVLLKTQGEEGESLVNPPITFRPGSPESSDDRIRILPSTPQGPILDGRGSVSITQNGVLIKKLRYSGINIYPHIELRLPLTTLITSDRQVLDFKNSRELREMMGSLLKKTTDVALMNGLAAVLDDSGVGQISDARFDLSLGFLPAVPEAGEIETVGGRPVQLIHPLLFKTEKGHGAVVIEGTFNTPISQEQEFAVIELADSFRPILVVKKGIPIAEPPVQSVFNAVQSNLASVSGVRPSLPWFDLHPTPPEKNKLDENRRQYRGDLLRSRKPPEEIEKRVQLWNSINELLGTPSVDPLKWDLNDLPMDRLERLERWFRALKADGRSTSDLVAMGSYLLRAVKSTMAVSVDTSSLIPVERHPVVRGALGGTPEDRQKIFILATHQNLGPTVWIDELAALGGLDSIPEMKFGVDRQGGLVMDSVLHGKGVPPEGMSRFFLPGGDIGEGVVMALLHYFQEVQVESSDGQHRSRLLLKIISGQLQIEQTMLPLQTPGKKETRITASMEGLPDPLFLDQIGKYLGWDTLFNKMTKLSKKDPFIGSKLLIVRMAAASEGQIEVRVQAGVSGVYTDDGRLTRFQLKKYIPNVIPLYLRVDLENSLSIRMNNGRKQIAGSSEFQDQRKLEENLKHVVIAACEKYLEKLAIERPEALPFPADFFYDMRQDLVLPEYRAGWLKTLQGGDSVAPDLMKFLFRQKRVVGSALKVQGIVDDYGKYSNPQKKPDLSATGLSPALKMLFLKEIEHHLQEMRSTQESLDFVNSDEVKFALDQTLEAVMMRSLQIPQQKEVLTTLASFTREVTRLTFGREISPQFYSAADATAAHARRGSISFAYNLRGDVVRIIMDFVQSGRITNDGISRILNIMTHELTHMDEKSGTRSHDLTFYKKFAQKYVATTRHLDHFRDYLQTLRLSLLPTTSQNYEYLRDFLRALWLRLMPSSAPASQ